jgi:hypothetical protein
MAKMISLRFLKDSPHMHPDGYWIATADEDDSPDYDAVGRNPLEAVMELARVLYEMDES